MKAASTALKYLILLSVIGATGYVLYPKAETFIAPCLRPVTYSVGEFDNRFDITKPELEALLADAAEIWNRQAGRPLIVAAPEGAVGVNLIYGERQQTTELGKVIDAEQAAYDAKKAEVDAFRASLIATKRSYEREAAAFKKDSDAYAAEVAYWNRQGGAPPEEYAKLSATGKALEARQNALNTAAQNLNASVAVINTHVEELNALAKKVNGKARDYNASAGEDFDQGEYVSDASGKRIDIYEFMNRADLERVLVHEFGHALGLGHVQNPESIMYSYNIGEDIVLTAEDIAELNRVCRLES